MRFKIKTTVKGNYKDVFEKFDRELFEYLLPTAPETRLVEFGGSREGDLVHIEFVRPFRAKWISEIKEDGMDIQKAWFVDEGIVLPFGLKHWRHVHIVRKVDDRTSEIIDDIEYDFANRFISSMLLPAVYLAFLPRKRQYRQYFNA